RFRPNRSKPTWARGAATSCPRRRPGRSCARGAGTPALPTTPTRPRCTAARGSPQGGHGADGGLTLVGNHSGGRGECRQKPSTSEGFGLTGEEHSGRRYVIEIVRL